MRLRERDDPSFALCGLNRALCPRDWTDGASRCPGCGGFSAVHPTCAVAACNARHDLVEHCFECSAYPCARYDGAGEEDSFITYGSVLSDMVLASEDLDGYRRVLSRKKALLGELVTRYDEGRRKSFFCLAANLLSAEDLERVLEGLRGGACGDRHKLASTAAALGEVASRRGVEPSLWKRKR